MKKIWKMKKSKEAVSPVIATILMVAITVVLAAVLYVMVMGFGSNPDQQPQMSTQKSTTQVAHEEKILVAAISDPQALANMQISLVINGGIHVTSAIAATPTWSTTSPSTALPGTTTVAYVDANADSKISQGDYFLVTNSVVGQSMSFSLLWGSESASIATETWTSF